MYYKLGLRKIYFAPIWLNEKGILIFGKKYGVKNGFHLSSQLPANSINALSNASTAIFRSASPKHKGGLNLRMFPWGPSAFNRIPLSWRSFKMR
jgi:hypothetical protein